jgi:hypothetical protein
MRTLITLLLLSALLLLSGCATTGEAAFYARQESAESARSVQLAALADTSACKDDRCVENTKAFAALAYVAGGGNAQPQQYVPQPSTAARVGLALIGQLSPLASAAVAWRSSDNSVRTAEAQFGFLGGVVRDVSSASARSNEAAFNMIPELQPNITAGQNIAFGDMQIAGRDLLGDGARVGDDTAISIGEINTGTQIENAGNYGDNNRQTSPDDNSQTTTCEGPGCQGVNRPITNPLPDPEEDEG